MREIKFRAWDKEYRRIIYGFPLVSHGEFNVFDFAFLKNWTTGFFPMQYTGLKDKNDKEIYEGDIIQWLWGSDDEEDRTRAIIRYGKGTYDSGYYKYIGFYLEALGESWAEGFNPVCEGVVEVIGNIYENPELLKKKGE